LGSALRAEEEREAGTERGGKRRRRGGEVSFRKRKTIRNSPVSKKREKRGSRHALGERGKNDRAPPRREIRKRFLDPSKKREKTAEGKDGNY